MALSHQPTRDPEKNMWQITITAVVLLVTLPAIRTNVRALQQMDRDGVPTLLTPVKRGPVS
jgi:hypothetical protein